MEQSATQFAREPRSREPPVAHHGLGGDVQHLRGFFDAQATEIAQFDDRRATGVQLREAVQRVIQCAERGCFVRQSIGKRIEIEALWRIDLVDVTASFDGRAYAGSVHQDAPHELRRDSEEMRPILPVDTLPVHEAYVGLVNQRGGLQRDARVFPAQVLPGQLTKLSVDKRREPLQRRPVPPSPGLQQNRDLSGLRWLQIGLWPRL
jgi:hypothetical protein